MLLLLLLLLLSLLELHKLDVEELRDPARVCRVAHSMDSGKTLLLKTSYTNECLNGNKALIFVLVSSKLCTEYKSFHA